MGAQPAGRYARRTLGHCPTSDRWTTGVKPWLAPGLVGEVGLEAESDAEENGRASGSSSSGDARSFPVRRNAFGADLAEACWAGVDGL